MTIVLGMLHNSGFTMAADTEETADDFKKSVSKLPVCMNKQNASLIVGGAGSAPHIETVTQMLYEKFADCSSKNLAKTEAAFRSVIQRFYKEHILVWPSHVEREDNDFSLLIGISIPTGSKTYLNRMLISQKGLLRNALPRRAIGRGANYAEALMDEYSGMHCSVLMSLIAIYIVQRVKRDTPYCGKETHVVNIEEGYPTSVLSPYVAQAESLFRKYEYAKSRMFITMMSLGPTETFNAYDNYVRQQMSKLSTEFQTLSNEIERLFKPLASGKSEPEP
jgi:hypothetical protein